MTILGFGGRDPRFLDRESWDRGVSHEILLYPIIYRNMR